MGAYAGPNGIEDGLVLCLDAGNTKSYPGSGNTWTDLSDQGNNGTLTNGPTFDSGNGGSIVFDGTNDFVNLGAVQINTASGTIGFWLKFDATIQSGYTGNQRPFGRNGQFEARWGGSTNFKNNLILDFGGSGQQIISNQGTWLNTQWYYIVITWSESANQLKLYVNNVLDKAGSCGTVSSLTGDLFIGKSVGTGQELDGKIAVFHSYNRILTAAEVQQNYNATRSRFGL